MGKFLADRPTLRGFLIIAAIVLAIMLLNLYTAVIAIGMLLRIAFFLAIAFFLFLVWRKRRGDIAMWQRSSQVAFYDHDRYFAPDITAIQSLVEAGAFHVFVPGLLPSR